MRTNKRKLLAAIGRLAVSVASASAGLPELHDAVAQKAAEGVRRTMKPASFRNAAQRTASPMAADQTAATPGRVTATTFNGTMAVTPADVPARAVQMSFNGDTYQYANDAAVEIKGDSIYMSNFFGWGTTISAKIDLATGLFDIKPQLVYDHPTYGEVDILSCDPASNTFDTKGTVAGKVQDGMVTIGPWAAVIMQGEYKNYTIGYGMHTRSDFRAPNSTMASVEQVTDTAGNVSTKNVTNNLWAESLGTNAVKLYNFAGTGAAITVYTRSDKTCCIAPTQLFSNSYGAFFCYPADWSKGSIYVRDIVGTTTQKALVLGNWGIYTNNGKYYYGRYLSTEITLPFDVTYPPAQENGWTGSGTEADPYQVATVADLFAIADAVNSAEIPEGAKKVTTFNGVHFKQTKAINLKGYQFTPIGGNDDMYRFGGIYDGDNKTISYLTVNTGSKGYAALFGAADTLSVIKNVSLSSPDITVDSYYYAGGVVAYGAGHVENCKVTNGNIKGALIVGGVCGSSGPATKLSFTGKVQGTSNIGGVIGNMRYPATFLSATNTEVTCFGGQDSYSAGGVIGYLTNSSLSGNTGGYLADSYFSGKVIMCKGGIYAGGVSGISVGAPVSRCFSIGEITNTATVSSSAIGGVVGAIQSTLIEDCFFAGNLEVPSQWAGSIAGYCINVQTQSGVTHSEIKNCYVTGHSRSTSNYSYTPYLGWFDTRTYGTAPTITNCKLDVTVMPRLNTAEGVTDLAAMTSDTPWEGYSTDVWTFEKGFYPSIKTIPANPVKNVAKAPILFTGADNVENTSSDFTMPGTNSVKWQVLKDGKLGTEGRGIIISGTNPYQGHLNGAIATDTVVASNGQVKKWLVVKLAPKSMFEGEGTAENPYKIATKEDLLRLSEATTTNMLTFDGAHFLITADIDMQGDQAFKGISCCSSSTYKFGGILDGGNHTLHGIKMNIPVKGDDGKVTTGKDTYRGFIGRLKAGGAVKNLRMGDDCVFNLWSNSGVFVAENYGDIINCRNYATVNAYAGTSGGICGYSRVGGRVIDCYNAGTINGGFHYVGGIAAYNYGLLSGCQNDGKVQIMDLSANYTASQYDGCGGIALANFGTITDCLNTGEVNGYKTSGGIVGWYNTAGEKMASNSLNIGTVKGNANSTYIGQIVGHLYKDKPLENCYWDKQTSTAKATESKDHEGGTGLTTAVLVSGDTIAGLSTTLWKYESGRYPMLKAFADEPMAIAASQAVVDFGVSEHHQAIKHDAKLAEAEGLVWSLRKPASAFAVNGKSLEMTAVADVLADTLVAVKGNYMKVIPVLAVPDSLEAPVVEYKLDDQGSGYILTFSCSEPQAVYFFTIDGNLPDDKSSKAEPTAVVPAGKTFTLKAFARHRNYFDSPVMSQEILGSVGIDGVNAGKEVMSRKYYNAAGIESTKPYDGYNITVTVYTDGTTTVTRSIR